MNKNGKPRKTKVLKELPLSSNSPRKPSEKSAGNKQAGTSSKSKKRVDVPSTSTEPDFKRRKLNEVDENTKSAHVSRSRKLDDNDEKPKSTQKSKQPKSAKECRQSKLDNVEKQKSKQSKLDSDEETKSAQAKTGQPNKLMSLREMTAELNKMLQTPVNDKTPKADIFPQSSKPSTATATRNACQNPQFIKPSKTRSRSASKVPKAGSLPQFSKPSTTITGRTDETVVQKPQVLLVKDVKDWEAVRRMQREQTAKLLQHSDQQRKDREEFLQRRNTTHPSAKYFQSLRDRVERQYEEKMRRYEQQQREEQLMWENDRKRDTYARRQREIREKENLRLRGLETKWQQFRPQRPLSKLMMQQ